MQFDFNGPIYAPSFVGTASSTNKVKGNATLGDYGGFFEISPGEVRIKTGTGSYLYFNGTSLMFYKSNGTSVTLV